MDGGTGGHGYACSFLQMVEEGTIIDSEQTNRQGRCLVVVEGTTYYLPDLQQPAIHAFYY